MYRKHLSGRYVEDCETFENPRLPSGICHIHQWIRRPYSVSDILVKGVFEMKLDTLIKFGSLALNVAQDEKVRELLRITHNGAKRRGFFDSHIVPPAHSPRRHANDPYGPHRPW
jgi:hypothetical protein